MEAWRNRLKFMRAVGASTGVYDRWNRHFVFLSGHENLKANFQSILMFDIEQRKEYAAHPTAFQEGLYHARFQEFKAENLEAKFTALKSSLAVRTTTPNVRHEPYPAGSSSSSSRSEPFSWGSGGSAGSPICLICGRTGHKFPACKTSITVMGKAVVAKLVGRRFETIASAQAVCISWNIGGSSRCSVDHPEHHTCSICGAKLHHAGSKTCVT